MAAAKNKYEVTNIQTQEKFIIEATSMTHDPSRGTYNFFDGEELVASQINVTIRKL